MKMREYINKEDTIKIIDKYINETFTTSRPLMHVALLKIKEAICNQNIIELPGNIGQEAYYPRDGKTNITIEKTGKYYKIFSMYVNRIKYYFIVGKKYNGFDWVYTDNKKAVDMFEIVEKYAEEARNKMCKIEPLKELNNINDKKILFCNQYKKD